MINISHGCHTHSCDNNCNFKFDFLKMFSIKKWGVKVVNEQILPVFSLTLPLAPELSLEAPVVVGAAADGASPDFLSFMVLSFSLLSTAPASELSVVVDVDDIVYLVQS